MGSTRFVDSLSSGVASLNDAVPPEMTRRPGGHERNSNVRHSVNHTAPFFAMDSSNHLATFARKNWTRVEVTQHGS